MRNEYIGRTIKIGDDDGDCYDATVLDFDGDRYTVDLNGLDLEVPAAEVVRQVCNQDVRRALGTCVIGLALVVAALVLL